MSSNDIIILDNVIIPNSDDLTTLYDIFNLNAIVLSSDNSVNWHNNSIGRDRYLINQRKCAYTKKYKRYRCSTYKFFFDSEHKCPMCLEKYKSDQLMFVNNCFHSWCNDCDDKLKTLSCPFCKKYIEPNVFFESYGYFSNNLSQHSIDLVQIIKDDLEKIDENYCEDEKKCNISESNADFILSKKILEEID